MATLLEPSRETDSRGGFFRPIPANLPESFSMNDPSRPSLELVDQHEGTQATFTESAPNQDLLTFNNKLRVGSCTLSRAELNKLKKIPLFASALALLIGDCKPNGPVTINVRSDHTPTVSGPRESQRSLTIKLNLTVKVKRKKS